MKNIGRVIGGDRARSAGETFEQDLSRAHDAYDALGIAKVRQLPVPTRSVGGANRVLIERQWFDFIGFFGPNAGPQNNMGAYHGLAIGMEAKRSSERTKWLYVRERGEGGAGIKKHQLQALVECYLHYGVVTALVYKNGEDRLVMTPSGLVSAWACVEAGQKKLPLDLFIRYEQVDYPEHPGIDDWLFELRRWLEVRGRPSPATSPRKAYDMIQYTINEATRTISIIDPKTHQPIKAFHATVLDRQMLDQCARDAKTPAEFEALVAGTSVTND